jgi:hypothetical protein
VSTVRKSEDLVMAVELQAHRIEDDLGSWPDAWVAAGLDQLEEYLAKHAAFELFLKTGED